MKVNHQYGLILGRFQPPCLHHFEFIKEVLGSGIQELIIGIGQPKELDSRHFLTSEEVRTLLIPNLDFLNFPYQIFTIPDINDPKNYVDHVQKIINFISENNTCLFTENTYTSDCFVNYGHNYQTIIPTILDNHATNVRQLIHDNDLSWQNFVPPNVSQFILAHSMVLK